MTAATATRSTTKSNDIKETVKVAKPKATPRAKAKPTAAEHKPETIESAWAKFEAAGDEVISFLVPEGSWRKSLFKFVAAMLTGVLSMLAVMEVTNFLLMALMLPEASFLAAVIACLGFALAVAAAFFVPQLVLSGAVRDKCVEVGANVTAWGKATWKRVTS